MSANQVTHTYSFLVRPEMSETPEAALFDAIYEGDLSRVEILLADQRIRETLNTMRVADIANDYVTAYDLGLTPLVMALNRLSRQHFEKGIAIVEALLRAGASPKQTMQVTSKGKIARQDTYSPLYIALSLCHLSKDQQQRLRNLMLKDFNENDLNDDLWHCSVNREDGQLRNSGAKPLQLIYLARDSLAAGEDLVRKGANPNLIKDYITESLNAIYIYLIALFNNLYFNETTDQKVLEHLAHEAANQAKAFTNSSKRAQREMLNGADEALGRKEMTSSANSPDSFFESNSSHAMVEGPQEFLSSEGMEETIGFEQGTR